MSSWSTGCVFLFLFGAFWPIIVSFVWQVFTTQTSPYAMIFATIVGYVFQIVLMGGLQSAMIENIALECWHMPEHMWYSPRFLHVPWLANKLSRKALKPAALKRAALLRARMGLEDLAPRGDTIVIAEMAATVTTPLALRRGLEA